MMDIPIILKKKCIITKVYALFLNTIICICQHHVTLYEFIIHNYHSFMCLSCILIVSISIFDNNAVSKMTDTIAVPP